MNGAQCHCIANNGVNPATHSVSRSGGGSTGGGGGGGAPSLFYLATCTLAALRALKRDTATHPAKK